MLNHDSIVSHFNKTVYSPFPNFKEAARVIHESKWLNVKFDDMSSQLLKIRKWPNTDTKIMTLQFDGKIDQYSISEFAVRQIKSELRKLKIEELANA